MFTTFRTPGCAGILIAAVLLLLAGCASTPLEGGGKPGRDGVYAVATLAPWGSFEHEAAPGYTRVAVARRIAAQRLDRKEINVEHAVGVQAAADAARAALDAARARADRGDRAGAQGDLGGALGLVERAEQLARWPR